MFYFGRRLLLNELNSPRHGDKLVVLGDVIRGVFSWKQSGSRSGLIGAGNRT